MRIFIDKLPPNINKFIGRTNIWEYHKLKKEYEQYVFNNFGVDKPFNKCKIDVTFIFPTKRKTDLNNYTKILLDSLVFANLILDDNYDCLVEEKYKGIYKKNVFGVFIEFEEMIENV